MIYLDNAATTRVYPEVLEEMKPYLCEYYGNPSSIYSFGEKSSSAVNHAREIIANSLNCKSSEIYFTSGGTESDNWALKSVAENYKNKGKHIITTKIEHHAILNTCKWLEKQGFEITYLDVDYFGIVDIEELENAIRDDTILISVMFANNEIGTIQPIKRIGEIAHKHNILFHTDAVQAYGHEKIDVKKLNIDLLSASGHKFHAPKGVGFLYINQSAKIAPLLNGGGQERHMRAGTENVASIVGMGKAAEITYKKYNDTHDSQVRLTCYLIERVLEEIPNSNLNGDFVVRLCNNANFSFDGIEGESLVIMLDMAGICVSSGSACSSGSMNPSHVLKAIGLSDEKAHSSIRITISEETTKEDINFTVDNLKKIIGNLRELNGSHT